MQHTSPRRNFLKKIGGTWLATALGMPASATALPLLPTSGNDENFWQAVRKAFPLRNHRVYFNNGTIGPSPYPVLESVKNALTHIDETGDYGHTDPAREAIATFFGVGKQEISLTHNTTEGINIVAWGLPLQPGDEVILNSHDHVGNALPWLNRAKIEGIQVKVFEPALTADENLHRIKQLIGPKTRVIAVPHVTCTTGLVLPIKEIVGMAKEKGIFTAIDGAQAPGWMALDLAELGCDTYAGCCHKWMLGPKGTGFLYVGEQVLDKVQARWVGGYSDSGWSLQTDPPEIAGYVPTAHRYDYGTQNAALFNGIEAGTDFLSGIGMNKVENRVRSLAERLQTGLYEIEKIEMLSSTEPASRGSMISFRYKGMDFREFNQIAAKNRFRIRVVPEAGLNALRVSLHIYNNPEEVDRFVQMVEEMG